MTDISTTCAVVIFRVKWVVLRQLMLLYAGYWSDWSGQLRRDVIGRLSVNPWCYWLWRLVISNWWSLSKNEQKFRLRAVSPFSLSVEQNAWDTQMTTREGARRERHDKRETTRKARENGLSPSSNFLAATLVSRVSRPSRSTLARACTPLTKSEEKERPLAV